MELGTIIRFLYGRKDVYCSKTLLLYGKIVTREQDVRICAPKIFFLLKGFKKRRAKCPFYKILKTRGRVRTMRTILRLFSCIENIEETVSSIVETVRFMIGRVHYVFGSVLQTANDATGEKVF